MAQSTRKGQNASSLFNRRHLLFAAIALSTPLFSQVVLGAPSSVTTDQAIELLGHHHKGEFRNYHGIVHPTSKSGVMRQEVNAASVPNRLSGDYPEKDQIPDVNHPQVKAWVAEIDWSKVPKIPVAAGLPDAVHFPQCPPDDDANTKACWYSCGGCVHDTDMITCPNTSDWGLTYDDGPSPATQDMMSHLKEKGLTATFFIVGSRVLEYPEILKDEVAQGHHLAMHTWSHAGLTTLTNEQIVAEVRWSEKIIRDVTGLTMKYIRPPYGDVDNRVREILRQMGYTTVIWTLGWDTNDWRLAMKQIKVPEVIETFKNALENRALVKTPQGALAGPVTLEHDLTDDTIELSKQILPLDMAQGLKPMSLAQCMNDASPYQTLQASSGGQQQKTSTDKSATNSTTAKPAPATSNGSTGKNATAGADSKGSAAPAPAAKDSTSTPVNEGTNRNSKAKSGAMTITQNGLQTMGMAAMGLTVVASYMLTL
ncbi:chitin deacetylase [Mortierella sp. AD094]|nr:chitin deacetylase [Mortierella sp. AD094]